MRRKNHSRQVGGVENGKETIEEALEKICPLYEKCSRAFGNVPINEPLSVRESGLRASSDPPSSRASSATPPPLSTITPLEADDLDQDDDNDDDDDEYKDEEKGGDATEAGIKKSKCTSSTDGKGKSTNKRGGKRGRSEKNIGDALIEMTAMKMEAAEKRAEREEKRRRVEMEEERRQQDMKYELEKQRLEQQFQLQMKALEIQSKKLEIELARNKKSGNDDE